MLIISLFVIYSVNCRNDVKHIGVYKFRFNDDVIRLANIKTNDEVNVNVNNDTKVGDKGSENKVFSEHDKNVELPNNLDRQSFLGLDKSNIQSIGYTVDNYPNPVLNPQLCIHTLDKGGKSLICDPDGILTENQQANLNKMLTASNVKIFMGLAYNVFTPSNKDEELSSFLDNLLKQWGSVKYKSVNDCLLVFYIKEIDTIKIAIGDGKMAFKDKFTGLEEVQEREHRHVYEDLEETIKKINNIYSYNSGRKTILKFSAFILIIALIWGVWKVL